MMAAPIKQREFNFPNAEFKLGAEFSCLAVIEREIPVGLSPKYLGNHKEFIKLILNKRLGRYDDRLQCIPVSVKKVRMLGNKGTICGEDPNIYFKVLAELIVFQPVVSSQVSARVEKISHSHIGLLVHEWFNASIPRNQTLTEKLNVGDEVVLEVIRTAVNRKILSLEGKFIKVLKRAEMTTESGVNKRKTFGEDEDEEVMVVTKKRSREDTFGSDSGYDNGTQHPDTTSGEPTDQPAKKKKKKKNTDIEESIKPDGSPKKLTKSPTKESGDSIINTSPTEDTNIEDANENDSLANKALNDEFAQGDSLVSAKISPKKGEKHKDTEHGQDITLDTTLNGSQPEDCIVLDSVQDDSQGDMVGSPTKKHKKSKKNKRKDMENEPDIVEVGSNLIESTMNESQVDDCNELDTSLSQSETKQKKKKKKHKSRID